MILYTDAATVAAALGKNSEGNISEPAEAGATTLTFDSLPQGWQIGMSIALDYYNPTLRETVQITASPIDTTVSITPTANDHVGGAPVVDCTGVSDWIAAATSLVDDATFMRIPGAFAKQTLVESVTAFIDNDGFLVVPCSLPNPQVSSITQLSYQGFPGDPVYAFALPPQAWVEGRFNLRIGNVPVTASREVMVDISYTGGYEPVPADIQRATVALAARLYKEKDSGFSDAIGNSELGILTYKKAIPADIKLMLNPHVRWA